MSFLALIDPHLNRLTQIDKATRVVSTIKVCIPIFLRSSSSGSAAQFKNVVTSLAICEAVASVSFLEPASERSLVACTMTKTDRLHTRLDHRKVAGAWQYPCPTNNHSQEMPKLVRAEILATHREVRVEVESLLDSRASGLVDISHQQREDVYITLSHVSLSPNRTYSRNMANSSHNPKEKGR
jgi:hypothetical protein